MAQGWRGIRRPIKYLAEFAEVQKLVEWVKEAMRTHMVDGNALDEMDAYHLSIMPNSNASWYMQMKAYGNHYKAIRETNVNTNGNLWLWSGMSVLIGTRAKWSVCTYLGPCSTWELYKI